MSSDSVLGRSRSIFVRTIATVASSVLSSRKKQLREVEASEVRFAFWMYRLTVPQFIDHGKPPDAS